MCSSYSAGFKWTANETRRDAYTVSVGFRCTNGSVSLETYCVIQLDCIVILYTFYGEHQNMKQGEVSGDRCFKKDGTAFIIPQLAEPFKTHIIGTELEPGTVCTFHATTKTFSPESDIDIVTASCTVGGNYTCMEKIYCVHMHACIYMSGIQKLFVHIIQI